MSLELLFLGTGTSAGVPMIGCDCQVCTSTDPRDCRTRPSVLIRYPDAHGSSGGSGPSASSNANPSDPSSEPPTAPTTRQWLIDTTPEMRLQVLRHRIDRVDGVMITHSHADHIFGLDDLRRFNAVMQKPIDLFTDAPTMDRLRRMFAYIFEPHTNFNQSFIANLITHEVLAGVSLDLFGARWTPLRLMHGRLPILGYRVDYPMGTPPISPSSSATPAEHDRSHSPGDEQPVSTSPPRQAASIAYCTDVSRIPAETYPLLEDLDVLVIDALRYRHHPTHLTVDQALDVIQEVRPNRAYLTHIAHDILHADLEARLPDHVALAFDGLCVRC